jgi:hypothetical protein
MSASALDGPAGGSAVGDKDARSQTATPLAGRFPVALSLLLSQVEAVVSSGALQTLAADDLRPRVRARR